jgi:hypothetical protein
MLLPIIYSNFHLYHLSKITTQSLSSYLLFSEWFQSNIFRWISWLLAWWPNHIPNNIFQAKRSHLFSDRDFPPIISKLLHPIYSIPSTHLIQGLSKYLRRPYLLKNLQNVICLLHNSISLLRVILYNIIILFYFSLFLQNA